MFAERESDVHSNDVHAAEKKNRVLQTRESTRAQDGAHPHAHAPHIGTYAHTHPRLVTHMYYIDARIVVKPDWSEDPVDTPLSTIQKIAVDQRRVQARANRASVTKGAEYEERMIKFHGETARETPALRMNPIVRRLYALARCRSGTPAQTPLTIARIAHGSERVKAGNKNFQTRRVYYQPT